MENSLKNQLERMSLLMEYQYSKNKSYLLNEQDNSSEEKEEKEKKFPFRMNRVGGNKIRIQDSETGDKIDVPFDLMEFFCSKLNSFRKV